MQYKNSEMKLDQLIGYFNDKKINLIPPFQRGHVWKLPARQKLIQNIVAGRPIPAIFLYKEADGSKYTYNILDGKQRLESLLLFIGDKRSDVKINEVKSFFFAPREKKMIDFPVLYQGKKQSFRNLSEGVVRDFREYSIPTIEINLDEEGSLDEVINLFVDINTQGEKVKRFAIVKAIGLENELLASVLGQVAKKEKRKEDMRYKKKNTMFTRVLQKLQTVESADGADQKVDRMWERLVEVVLFCRSGKHRAPGQILKSFIRSTNAEEKKKITPEELKKLKVVFGFLDKAYASSALGRTRLATNLPDFYTMVTSLIKANFLVSSSAPAPDWKKLETRLLSFAKYLHDDSGLAPALIPKMQEYRKASARQTTHPGQRDIRQKNFVAILEAL